MSFTNVSSVKNIIYRQFLKIFFCFFGKFYYFSLDWTNPVKDSFILLSQIAALCEKTCVVEVMVKYFIFLKLVLFTFIKIFEKRKDKQFTANKPKSKLLTFCYEGSIKLKWLSLIQNGCLIMWISMSNKKGLFWHNPSKFFGCSDSRLMQIYPIIQSSAKLFFE